MTTLELNRDLISLARQGGATLTELRDRRRAAAQVAREKAEKTAAAANAKGGKPELGRSNSVPSMSTTQRTTGLRRGGGFERPGDEIDLTPFKEKVDSILRNKASLDYCEKPYFRTALWEAAWKNHEAIVRLLANKGANVAAPDYQGRTPLHEAAFYGHTRLLSLLLEKGHPIDCVDVFGQTPLFRAVEGGRPEVVRMLVERGAHTNSLDADNVTVQHIAAFNGMPALSQFLLHNGAIRNRFTLDETAPSLRSSPGPGFAATKLNLQSPLKAGATLMFGSDSLPQRRALA